MLLFHCDVTPNNILLDTTHTPPRPVVSDFGLAKLMSVKKNNTSPKAHRAGPLYYMAPEADCHTPATDIYGLAIICFELFCGKTLKELSVPSTPLPALSSQVQDIAPLFR